MRSGTLIAAFLISSINLGRASSLQAWESGCLGAVFADGLHQIIEFNGEPMWTNVNQPNRGRLFTAINIIRIIHNTSRSCIHWFRWLQVWSESMLPPRAWTFWTSMTWTLLMAQSWACSAGATLPAQPVAQPVEAASLGWWLQPGTLSTRRFQRVTDRIARTALMWSNEHKWSQIYC